MCSAVVCFPGWMGRLRPSCHQFRGNPNTSPRLVMDSTWLDFNCQLPFSSRHFPPEPSDPVRYEMITSVSFLPDCRTISASPRSPQLPFCHPAPPDLHMLLSSTQTLTRASHLISIGPDRACLELSEPPPSCTPICHTSGTISKEQAPFQTDCPLSCRHMAHYGSD